jgi:hypothetical protein
MENSAARDRLFTTSFLRGCGKTDPQAVDLAQTLVNLTIYTGPLQLRDSTGLAPVSPFSLPIRG